VKRLSRDPVRFDVFDAFTDFCAQEGISVRDSEALDRFMVAVKDATMKSLETWPRPAPRTRCAS